MLFDEVLEIMEEERRHPTKEQQQAIIQSFKDVVQERIELKRALSFVPTQEQLQQYLDSAPTSQEELKAIVDAEQAYPASTPEAKAACDERRAAHAITAGFSDLQDLKEAWADALQRNDIEVVAPLMNEALARNGIALPPNLADAPPIPRILEPVSDIHRAPRRCAHAAICSADPALMGAHL